MEALVICTDDRGCKCDRCARTMSRRWFLGAAGAIGAGLLLADKTVDVGRYVYETKALAPLPPGWSAKKTDAGLYVVKHNLGVAEFRKIVQDELNEVFTAVYSHRDDEWGRVFSGRIGS